jgi:leucyl/phenylalanyl-tRNA--protein transferase
MRRRQVPLLIAPGGPLLFPDPRLADDEGLVAIGGDLSVQRLLFAYEAGIFPWHDEGLPPLWWSPDPRTILQPRDLSVSRSMRRVLKSGKFTVSYDHAFQRVMRACGSERPEGTWILPEMLEAYTRLHRLGHAHSIEVWCGDELAGGLYGVQRGALFAAESMFHRVSNASKVALVVSVLALFRAGIELYDVQFLTQHLASLGARPIRRTEYLERLATARETEVDIRHLDVSGFGPQVRAKQAASSGETL